MLPIGGIKEKLLAAKRAKIKTIIMPALNRRDIDDLSNEVTRGMKFRFVEHISEVLEAALRPAAKTMKAKV